MERRPARVHYKKKKNEHTQLCCRMNCMSLGDEGFINVLATYSLVIYQFD